MQVLALYVSRLFTSSTDLCLTDALQGVPAARAIVTPINTRLKHQEVAYILGEVLSIFASVHTRLSVYIHLEHSGARLVLVDYEYLPLVKGTSIPIIVCNDTGLSDDPYERFLSSGRRYSNEKGWAGLEAEVDENAPAVLCYT